MKGSQLTLILVLTGVMCQKPMNTELNSHVDNEFNENVVLVNENSNMPATAAMPSKYVPRELFIKTVDINGEKIEYKRKVNIVATFYTGSAKENGGFANLTATGKKLSRGICASNNFDFGTKIFLDGYGVYEVQDRGNPKYIRQIDDETYRIDIYVPIRKTAMKLGVKLVQGYILE